MMGPRKATEGFSAAPDADFAATFKISAYIMSYMDQRTTVQVPRPVLKRLQKYRRKGETYGDALAHLMDIADRERYIEKQFAIARDKKNLISESSIKWD